MVKNFEEVLRELKKFRENDMDYRDGMIMSSMCTPPFLDSDKLKKIFEVFYAVNIGDSRISRGSQELERKVIQRIGGFLGNKKAEGYITTGGTESNIFAIMYARMLGKREKRISKGNIVVPDSAHFSFQKIEMMGIEVRRAELNPDRTVNVESLKKLMDDNTFAVVGIAGNTEYGRIDDIEAIGEICYDRDIFLHIDAAFGGFVVPFIDKKYRKKLYGLKSFDFSIEGVSSITVDPHKMGMSIIPSGGILFRKMKDVFDLKPHYIQARCTLTGTRSAFPVAVTYATLELMGVSGFRKVVGGCIANTLYFREELERRGIETLDPTLNILNFKLENLPEGYAVSSTREGYRRAVIMPHVKREDIDRFIHLLHGW